MTTVKTGRELGELGVGGRFRGCGEVWGGGLSLPVPSQSGVDFAPLLYGPANYISHFSN